MYFFLNTRPVKPIFFSKHRTANIILIKFRAVGCDTGVWKSLLYFCHFKHQKMQALELKRGHISEGKLWLIGSWVM